jgi:hypothetical protein
MRRDGDDNLFLTDEEAGALDFSLMDLQAALETKRVGTFQGRFVFEDIREYKQLTEFPKNALERRMQQIREYNTTSEVFSGG